MNRMVSCRVVGRLVWWRWRASPGAGAVRRQRPGDRDPEPARRSSSSTAATLLTRGRRRLGSVAPGCGAGHRDRRLAGPAERGLSPAQFIHSEIRSRPERGRNEVEPAADRALPEPAESFSRSWSTSSDVEPVYGTPRRSYHRAQPINSTDPDTVPATITDPETYPQNFNPPVIINPRGRRRP
jgi:hypothetical protein